MCNLRRCSRNLALSPHPSGAERGDYSIHVAYRLPILPVCWRHREIGAALNGEGPSPAPPSMQPCGYEGGLLCGSGRLAGDEIFSFNVLNRTPEGLDVSLRYRYKPGAQAGFCRNDAARRRGIRARGRFLPHRCARFGRSAGQGIASAFGIALRPGLALRGVQVRSVCMPPLRLPQLLGERQKVGGVTPPA